MHIHTNTQGFVSCSKGALPTYSLEAQSQYHKLQLYLNQVPETYSAILRPTDNMGIIVGETTV